jgi:hypothetical protein
MWVKLVVSFFLFFEGQLLYDLGEKGDGSHWFIGGKSAPSTAKKPY